MRVLVCGGAGYIGSHMNKMLAEHGHEVVVMDNLSRGYREAVQWGEFVQCDLRDPDGLDALFAKHRIDAVMHFSALIAVGESVEQPDIYYENNVVGTFNLVQAMAKANVPKIVFSSTAAVYGEPESDMLTENDPIRPLNAYGRTKAVMEGLLADYAVAYGLKSVCFRYFNAAGADPSGCIGEAHDPETHLIPLALMAAQGSRGELAVFGTDYPTHDGTCVRDYIHINDICSAHLKAIDYMDAKEGAHVFNLGNGKGFTVLEVLESIAEVTGLKVPHSMAERRPGDSPYLVADSTRAGEILGWTPQYTNLSEIIETAWRWQSDRKY